MRILVASDSFPPKVDGVSDTTMLVASRLRERGHAVVVLTAIPGEPPANGLRVVRAPSVPFPLYPEVRASWPFGRARRIIDRFRPDAAVVLTPGPIGIAVTRALPPTTRLVHVYTTDIPRYLRDYHLGAIVPLVERQLRQLTERADRTLCPTEVVRADLERRGHARLEVWGRGVDTVLFNPGRRDELVRSRLAGGEPEKPLVLYVGRLAREKRLVDLFHAARQTRGVRFAIVGDGPQRDLLERQFSEVPAVFTGYLRGKELATAFACGDIFAFPSDSETFGQVVLQAMASGVPPVVCRDTAPAEFVTAGAAGVHVPPRNPAAIAQAIERLSTNVHERREMGRAATASAASFSWERLVERLEVLLDGQRGE